MGRKTLQVRTASGAADAHLAEIPLGSGGEGAVLDATCPQIPGPLVAKVFHSPDPGRRQKVEAMASRQPPTDAVAWPLGALYDQGRFAGYLMPKLDPADFRPWSELCVPADRRATASGFTLRYAYTACRNLLAAVSAVHEASVVLGDVNESNVFVSGAAGVKVIDIDSAQVDVGGKVLPCTVGKPEFTAPEVSHGHLKDHVRTPQTDLFACAVMVFQMLTGGCHPTEGVWTGAGDPPSVVERARAGAYPALAPADRYEPASRIPSECLPSQVRSILLEALAPDPAARPSFTQVLSVLDKVTASLVQCPKEPAHWGEPGECLWCRRREAGGSDPWGSAPRKVQQAELPSVSFSQAADGGPVVRRQPVTRSAPAAGAPAPAGTSPASTSAARRQPSRSEQVEAFRAQAAALPEVRKGRTLLQFQDGTCRPRPSLVDVARSSTGLALSCVNAETPRWLRLRWSHPRRTAGLWPVVLGWPLGVAASGGWMLAPVFITQGPPLLWWWLSVVLAVLGAVAVTWCAASGLRDRARTAKACSLEGVETERWWVSVSRFLVLPVVYGPAMLAGALVLAVDSLRHSG